MYKIHEKYTDFDGNEREEDFLFNLKEDEVTHMQFGTSGGLAAAIKKIIATQDTPRLIAIFEEILDKSYGEKTPDGRGFHKDPALTQSFKETEAYSQIYMRLATNADAAQEFINNVIPKSMQEKAKQMQQNNPIPMK